MKLMKLKKKEKITLSFILSKAHVLSFDYPLALFSEKEKYFFNIYEVITWEK